jgi:glycosyltransferase involved in cell wall biosynthesis
MSSKEGVPKVLHCVERMDTNAIETWLARMQSHALRTNVPVDWWFHVQFKEPGRLEKVYPECRSRIIRSPCTLSETFRFFSAFYLACKTQRFDVIHVHADLMSAPYVLAGRLAGVRHIIVHVHNSDECLPTPSTVKQRLLREPMRQICLRMADRVVGISNHTLDSFLGGRARRPGRDSVHYYGVNPAPFANTPADRSSFRRELRLPEAAVILLFAGRMVPEKNPVFAVEVLRKLRELTPHAFAVFAGSGSHEQHVLQRARELEVEDGVRLLGWRDDLPEIMSCSDWFILPHPEHPMEGFGLAVVEAQLAGMRMLLSHGIPDDPLLPTACFRRLPMAYGPMVWAKAAVELLRESAPSRAAAIAAMKESPMDMDRALEGLVELHA